MKRLQLLLLLIFAATILYSKTLEYKVESGDTLYGIALKYGTTTNNIINENNLKSSTLKVDQILKISITEVDEYIVSPGDTLSGIAFKYGITLKHLLLVNRITEDYKIKVGEVLTIPTEPQLKKTYTVKSGDTLSWVSMAYNQSIDELIKINNLEDENLKIGQVLNLGTNSIEGNSIKEDTIKLASVDINLPGDTVENVEENREIYTVVPGDTLSGIAYEYQTSIEDIQNINNFSSSHIMVGQKIELPSYSLKRAPIDYNLYHEVVRGDTLSGIAVKYDISETLLMELNNLKSDRISIGDKIKLIPKDSREYTVERGDTLWSIARNFKVSVDQLMQYNHLNSTIVNEGKILNIYDYSVAKHNDSAEEKEYNLVALKYNHNTTESQPYKNYSLDSLINPLDKYNKAKDNWKKYSALIEEEELMSNDLSGWTVIIDPGHGGKDPGAIATVTLDGQTKYIVEDEYAYDTAVRLFELLKRNGAEAYMTILSPDHVARNPVSNNTTFINEKNEIYNNYNLNKINNSTIWPVGGQWGLYQRVLITNNILSTTTNKNTIFISLHADNDVNRGIGKLVLYRENNTGIDSDSKKFAQAISDEFGVDSSIDSMSLAVLHNNNADYKVLIELRNMAHLSEAMALLDSDKRQDDALMILNGIKNFIKPE